MSKNMNLIVAASENRAIGLKGALPWRLRDELKRFKEITMGGVLVMGRKTFDSIPKLLPGRETWVLTRDESLTFPDEVRVFFSQDDVLAAAALSEKQVFISGGAQIYKAFFPHCDTLYHTVVKAQIAGDTYFPRFNLNDWEKIAEYFHKKDERNTYAWTMSTYERAI